MNNITIILIMFFVLIVIPIIFARLSGRDPMEVFFGSRVKGSAFAAKDKEEVKKESETKNTERNSDRNDLLVTLSDLISYTRRNRFYVIMPGTLQYQDKMANLGAIIITRGAVIGVNCFGYGGTVTAGSGKDDWSQRINGEKKRFESPVVKNGEQEQILKDVLAAEGLQDVESRVIGVFTSPSVQLTGAGGTGCYTRNTLKKYLASDECMVSRNITPKEVGKKLEPYIKRK